jgi:hypothetical protein
MLHMEQYTLRNANNFLNTNIYSYLETSGGQSSNLYSNDVHIFNNSVKYEAEDSCFPAYVQFYWSVPCICKSQL